MKNFRNEPVLFVDDEKENLAGFEFSFLNDYKVFLAQNAEEGLKILKQNRIKVIISDQRMPGMAGIEFFRKIKNEFPESIRIILTAFVNVDDAVKAINEGEIFRYLSKPWDKTELMFTINNAIETYNLRQENIKLLENLKQTNDELRSKNKELIQAKNKAEQSDILKSAFLANMSHEIRTPMNSIIGFIQFFRNTGLISEKRDKFINIIEKSSYQLLSIINDIIDISKIESNQLYINNQNVNIHHVLLEVFNDFNTQFESNQIEFSYINQIKNTDIEYFTDEKRLKQILTNLIGNALKFTSKGKVEFGYSIKDDKIEFWVKDTGIGIAPTDTEVIFDRFRQIETNISRNYGGTGLGLAISKALAKNLGGDLWVNSELGIGSTFHFSIELSKEQDNPVNFIIKKSETNTIPDWSSKSILIAEDEESNYIYLEEILMQTRVKIIRARNGLEAIEVVNAKNIDLILMDIKMPIMDGKEATIKIKLNMPGIPIIAQTAFTMKGDEKEFLEAGCDDYISKPVLMKTLFDKIGKLIGS